MTILYSSSDSYAFLAGISILSLLENNKYCQDIHIYIMDNAISDENKLKLIQIVNGYGRELSFVPMPSIEKMTGQSINTRRWNISTFGRLYMASALPETVHKVMNIDCDTMILGSVEGLWNTDLSGKICAGVSDCFNDRYRRNIDLKDGEIYLNGGMILLNLDAIREGGFERKFTNYIATYGESLAYLDQDVLNAVIPQNGFKVVPLQYNVFSLCFYTTYKQLLKIRRSNCFYSSAEFYQAKQDPVIVHFTTCFLDGLRPWIKGNRHPYLRQFLEYKELSPWADLPLQKDCRSILNKFRSKIIKKAPDWLVCEVASVLHGIIVPERNRRRMEKKGKLK